MPRTSRIRYYESRQAYYTQFQGRQHLLAAGPKDEPEGPTFRAATLRYGEIMNSADLAKKEDNSLVSAVIARHCYMLKQAGKLKTLERAESMMASAIACFGPVKVKELKPFAVTDWLDKMTTWNDTTKHGAISHLKRVFNWAVGEGWITTNPIARMAKPEPRVRGESILLPDGLVQVLFEIVTPALGKIIRFMIRTGCRPGEAVHATISNYRPEIPALVFSWNPPAGGWRWKNARKSKRDRVIYLTPDMVDLVRTEAGDRKPGDRLFVSQRGRAWTVANLGQQLRMLQQRDEVLKWCQATGHQLGPIMGYAFRHGYITTMIKRGCPIKLLADLCGTSVRMIERHYSHAHDDHAAMLRLLLQFVPPASSDPSSTPESRPPSASASSPS